jgi:hypothetical protein
MNEYIGVDWSRGLSNRDPQNMEMHYGIISQHAIGDYALDSLEDDFGVPTCPKCGDDAIDYDDDLHSSCKHEKHVSLEYTCVECQYAFGSESAYPEMPMASCYKDDSLEVIKGGDDSDLWVLKSEFYTLCAYCSPCAPGAGDLIAQRKTGIKAYCLPLDWFDTDNPCPYKIYKVSDDTLVYDPTTSKNEEENTDD